MKCKVGLVILLWEFCLFPTVLFWNTRPSVWQTRKISTLGHFYLPFVTFEHCNLKRSRKRALERGRQDWDSHFYAPDEIMLLADKSGAGWLGKMWFISCRALNSSVIEIIQIFYENISIGQCFLFIEEIFSYPKNLSKLNLKKNAQAAWPAKFCPEFCLGQTSCGPASGPSLLADK